MELTISNKIPTMTSLELVDYINSDRRAEADEAGEAFPSKDHPELRHDNFMVKVQEVLKKAAPNFLGTAFYINGTGAKVPRSIYTFPKREACLMAMSYSYELQAKVFDRMTALEERQVRVQTRQHIEDRVLEIVNNGPLEDMAQICKRAIARDLIRLATPKVQKMLAIRLAEQLGDSPEFSNKLIDTMTFYTVNISELLHTEAISNQGALPHNAKPDLPPLPGESAVAYLNRKNARLY